jgi:DNA mismatch repair protein MutS
MEPTSLEDYFIQTHKYKLEYGEKQTVVFMQIGSFYEVYALRVKNNEDIEYICNKTNLSVSAKQRIRENNYYFGNTNIDTIAKVTDLAIATKSNMNYSIYIMKDGSISYVHPKFNNKIYDMETFEQDSSSNYMDYFETNIKKKQTSTKNITKSNDIMREIKCDVCMCGFTSTKDYIVEKYIQKLLNCGYTIPLFDQYDCEDDPSKKYRELSQIISSGTYFNDNTTSLSNNICVIRFHYSSASIFSRKSQKKQNNSNVNNGTLVIGMSSIDVITGMSNYYEYTVDFTNSPSMFDELDYYLLSNSPKELLCICDSSQSISFNNKKQKLDCKLLKEWCSNLEYNQNTFRYIDINSTYVDENTDEITNKIQSNIQKRASNADKQQYQTEIIREYYGEHIDINAFVIKMGFDDNICAFHAYCFLLEYVSKHNRTLLNNITEPTLFKTNNNMIVGNHSYKQLNYLNSNQATDMFSNQISKNIQNSHYSVVDFLSKCKTNMGKRELKKQLVVPKTDVDELNKLYDVTDFFIHHKDYCSSLYTSFVNFCDIEKYTTLMSIGASKFDVNKLYTFVNSIRLFDEFSHNFNSYIEDNDIIDETIHDNFSNFNNDELVDFTNHINTSIYSKDDIDSNLMEDYKQNDPVFVSQYNNIITNNIFKPTIHTDIDVIVTDLFTSLIKLESIRQFFCDCIAKQENKKSNTNISSFCKLYKTEKDNISIRMTKTRKSKLEKCIKDLHKNSKQNYINLKSSYLNTYIDECFDFNFDICDIEYKTATSSTILVESSYINELVERISYLENEWKNIIREQYSIFIDNTYEKYNGMFSTINSYIVNYDIGMTKALLSIKYNYCRPTIERKDVEHDNSDDTSYINAKQMRHILIEHFLTDEIYVPNDIYLDSESSTILFGTNAVGKSSLIKSIGICVLLAQCGFYVPCESFTYYPYKSLFTRILGNDNIFKGLSTFAVEMTEFNNILKHTNKYSLVLGDELCSGTEMASAMSIFIAGLYYLIKKQSNFIFASHFHEILDNQTFRGFKDKITIKHLSVTYDSTSRELIYDRILKDGPGEQNYGIEVCKSLHLPDDFIQHALLIRDELDNNIKDKYYGTTKTVCEADTSIYNNKKIKVKCEKCGKKEVDDVHHMQYQQDANDAGYIGSFHKNSVANLMNLCKECHNDIHATKKRIVRKKKIKMVKPRTET